MYFTYSSCLYFFNKTLVLLQHLESSGHFWWKERMLVRGNWNSLEDMNAEVKRSETTWLGPVKDKCFRYVSRGIRIKSALWILMFYLVYPLYFELNSREEMLASNMSLFVFCLFFFPLKLIETLGKVTLGFPEGQSIDKWVTGRTFSECLIQSTSLLWGEGDSRVHRAAF